MKKLDDVVMTIDRNLATVFCPACQEPHGFILKPDYWTWNGDRENPTFQPSLLLRRDGVPDDQPLVMEEFRKPMRCHSTIINGIWNYHADCLHEMANMKVPMVRLPDKFR